MWQTTALLNADLAEKAGAETERLEQSIKTIIKEDGVVVSRQAEEIERLVAELKEAQERAIPPHWAESFAEIERLRGALKHADGLIAVWAVSDRDAGVTLNEIAEVLRAALQEHSPDA